MKIRIVVAALLGGLTLFVWGGISHMVIHLGDTGLQSVPLTPADAALVHAIRTTVPASGIYLYPGMDMKKSGDEAAMKAWEESTKDRPHGIIVNVAEPYGGMGPQLGKEFMIDIGVALVSAILLSWALGCCGTFLGRVGFVTVLGLIAAMRPVQQMVWYSFPSNFTLGQVADGLIGFLLMGIVLGLIVKPATTAAK